MVLLQDYWIQRRFIKCAFKSVSKNYDNFLVVMAVLQKKYEFEVASLPLNLLCKLSINH